jgi:hypothetical protein
LQKRCSVVYHQSVFTVDLKDLTWQWNLTVPGFASAPTLARKPSEASNAFFLFRYFRKSKVRRQLQPHMDGKVSGDIRNDLFLLSQIDVLQREAFGLESLKPLFGERWTGIETETSDLKNWTSLADDLLAQIKTIPNGADKESAKDKVRVILDERFANNIVHPPPVVSSQSLQTAWGQVEGLLPKM